MISPRTRRDASVSAYPKHIQDFLHLLETSPEFRALVRSLLLSEELLQLPDLVRSLAATQERLAQQLESFQQAVERALAAVSAQQAETAAQIAALVDRMEQVEQQQAATTEQIRQLTVSMERVEAQIEALTARMERVEAQIEALTERMERVEAQIGALTERMERVEAQIEALTARMERVEAQIEALTARMERVEAQIEALTARMERVEAQIEALTARMERVEAQIEALTARMERVEAQIEALTEQMQQMAAQIAALTERMQDFERRLERVERDLGRLKGLVLPLVVERRFGGLFRKILRRPRVLPSEELTRLVEDGADAGLLDEREAEQLLLVDLVLEGRDATDGGEPIYVVCEISWGVGISDILRARERAALLERVARRPVRPAVLGTWLTREGEEALADVTYVAVPESFFD
jgi:archaellum component FlaC